MVLGVGRRKGEHPLRLRKQRLQPIPKKAGDVEQVHNHKKTE